jgi:hypothetical protein
MQEKNIIQKKRELVMLAKKTNNMPTLIYAYNKMIDFCVKEKKENRLNWSNKENIIDIMHKAMVEISPYPYQQKQKPTDNFLQVMDNWKEYKKNNDKKRN